MDAATRPNAPHRKGWFLAVLGVLLGFASISTDLYLPALPTMALALGAGEGVLQWTVSVYLIGFAAGQLFWGPLSDYYGRRVPVAFGVIVFAIGSAGCALSTDAWQIIGWRVVQALGASAGVALARAMVRDLYDRDHAAKVLSTLMTIMAVAPLLGPSVGAQILEHASWRAIFWTLVAIGLLVFVAIITLPETTVFIYSSMNGFILANAVAGALSAVATRTGAASALIGAIQYGSGMVGSALVGLLGRRYAAAHGCHHGTRWRRPHRCETTLCARSGHDGRASLSQTGSRSHAPD